MWTVDATINDPYKNTNQQAFMRELPMRTLGAAILATSLIASSAFAGADLNSSAPLAPGKPAGVKQAQMHGALAWWLVGIGVVGLGIGLVASGNGNSSSTPATVATTTTTSP